MPSKLREYLLGSTDPVVSAQELAIFTRQLSTMLDAGIPLHHALDCFGNGMVSGDLQHVLNHVANKVSSGYRLSRALRIYPSVFSPVFYGLVETGENTGHLTDALSRLADLLEKQVKMRQRIIATVTYPAVLFVISLMSVAAFVVFILPMTEPLFKSLNMTLPLPTRILLKSRTVLPWASLVALIVLLIMRFGRDHVERFLRDRPELSMALERFPTAVPMFGGLYVKIKLTRILYSLASMVDTGLGIVQSLNGCMAVAGNAYIASRLKIAQAEIVEGKLLSDALLAAKIFPPAAVHVVRAGEETSSLPVMLRYAADLFEEDTDLALMNLAAALEPMLMVGMGVVVGFIVLSAILPTLQLIQNL